MVHEGGFYRGRPGCVRPMQPPLLTVAFPLLFFKKAIVAFPAVADHLLWAFLRFRLPLGFLNKPACIDRSVEY